MKRLFYWFTLGAIALSVSFTSCNDDDDKEKDNPEVPENPTNPGGSGNNETIPTNADILGNWLFETAEYRGAEFGNPALEAELTAWINANKSMLEAEMADFAGDEFEFKTGGKLYIHYAEDDYVEQNTYVLTGSKIDITDEDDDTYSFTVSLSGNKLYLDANLIEIYPGFFPDGITAIVFRLIFVKKT